MVSNLTVSGVTDTSATLSFTQSGDGLGGVASYDIRFAPAPISFASATPVTRGTCATPVVGTAAGAPFSCVLYGLTANTTYNFQVMPFRGTLNVNAVLGPPSNVALATTAVVPVTSVTVSPGTATTNVGPGGAQFTAVLKDAQGNVITGRPINWSSSNPAVATISPSGLATGLTVGTVTITATSGAGTGTATLSTTAPPGFRAGGGDESRGHNHQRHGGGTDVHAGGGRSRQPR